MSLTDKEVIAYRLGSLVDEGQTLHLATVGRSRGSWQSSCCRSWQRQCAGVEKSIATTQSAHLIMRDRRSLGALFRFGSPTCGPLRLGNMTDLSSGGQGFVGVQFLDWEP
jgi:hypothetical protein